MSKDRLGAMLGEAVAGLRDHYSEKRLSQGPDGARRAAEAMVTIIYAVRDLEDEIVQLRNIRDAQAAEIAQLKTEKAMLEATRAREADERRRARRNTRGQELGRP